LLSFAAFLNLPLWNPGIATNSSNKPINKWFSNRSTAECAVMCAQFGVTKTDADLEGLRTVLARMADRRECCDEKSRQNVANKRDGRTMVLFSRARGKLRLNTSRGGILLSLGALTGLGHFPVG
jgi:hypothetical protein